MVADAAASWLNYEAEFCSEREGQACVAVVVEQEVAFVEPFVFSPLEGGYEAWAHCCFELGFDYYVLGGRTRFSCIFHACPL